MFSQRGDGGSVEASACLTALSLSELGVELTLVRALAEERAAELFRARGENEHLAMATRCVAQRDNSEQAELALALAESQLLLCKARDELGQLKLRVKILGNAGDRAPHFARSPAESPVDGLQPAAPLVEPIASDAPPQGAGAGALDRARQEFAVRFSAVLRESGAVSGALQAEVQDLEEQNRRLREHLSEHEQLCQLRGFIPGSREHSCWEAWQRDLLRPLQRMCEEQQQARAQAESEALRWRQEVATLERDVAWRQGAFAAAESQAAAVRAVAVELCGACAGTSSSAVVR
mmetsp:Transcript_123427/g.394271  ORF Transcript_123427/g.394271 Transcript_123427/m.394271 type:complete len:292 (+) Transcript_123427:545-1420(+)